MKRWHLILVLIFTLSLLSPSSNAQAGGIEVISVTQQNNFPSNITFNLSVRASAKIVGITFFYKSPNSSVTSFSNPPFKSSENVETQFKLSTAGGDLAPTSKIDYYWQIRDSEGNDIKTQMKEVVYDDTRFQWKSIERDGLTLRWYEGSQNRANELLDAAVSAMNRLTDQAGVKYERPIRILVYNSKQDMDAVVPKISDTFGQETNFLGIRLTPEVLAVLGSDNEIKETLAHELSHQVVGQVVDNPYGDIPTWLNEGLSMNAESVLPARNKSSLDSAIKNDELISVRSLSSYPADPKKVNLFYGEAYSVVRYLTDTYGRDKMKELLAVFKEGTGYDDALRRVYGFDMDGLDANWRKRIGAKPRNLDDVGSSKSREDSGFQLPGISALSNVPMLTLLVGALLSGLAGFFFLIVGSALFVFGRKR